MALQFPSNPTDGQSYQTGSSATYIYNYSGAYWSLELGPATTPLYASLSQSFGDTITTERGRISTLETDILGYEEKGRNLVSGSSQVKTLLPSGAVSGSSQVTGILASVNSYTSSLKNCNNVKSSDAL